MKICYDEMPGELQRLYDEYYENFGMFPDEYAELEGQCPEAFDIELIKEAIKKKVELPTLVLGAGYENNGVDYG